MIRVGDVVTPFFDARIVGTVVSIETLNAKDQKVMYTTEGTTTGIRVATIKLPDSSQIRFKVEDLLKANV